MTAPASDGITLTIRALPRSGRSGFAGVRGDAWLVRLRASPVDGAANDELIEIVADALDVPRQAVSISRGSRSRQKLVRVSGIDLATARLRLMQVQPER